ARARDRARPGERPRRRDRPALAAGARVDVHRPPAVPRAAAADHGAGRAARDPGCRTPVTAPTTLVTGAGRGIGRATVLGFLGAGWRAVAGVRDPAAARASLPERDDL